MVPAAMWIPWMKWKGNRQMAKELGKHDFSGSCAPRGHEHVSMRTFSVGIFQWVASIDPARPKKGKVKVRVRGWRDMADAVYAEARRICDLLDKGEYKGPKNVTVGTK